MRIGLAIALGILPAVLTPIGATARTVPDLTGVDVPAAEGFGAMTANDWLGRLDADDYDGSYEAAASAARNTTTPETWSKKLRGLRRPLGKLVSRQSGAAAVERSLPGLPDGLYVIVEFDSVFERKKKCVEVVTVMQEADGALKVARYAVRSKPGLPRNRPPPPTNGRLPGG
jgi:hypothetical protein